MTLLEVMLAVLVMSIVAAILMPVIMTSTDAYATAADAREATDRAAFALDRVASLLREAPAGAQPGTVGIVTAGQDVVELSDGGSVELVGTDLVLTLSGLEPAVLCRGVEQFRLDFLGADGVTDTSTDPEATRTFRITIATGGMELRSAVFARVTIGTDPP